MNTLILKGNWNIAKGKLKRKYAQLTEDDLQYAEGCGDELVGRIQKRTGQAREAIEQAVRECFAARETADDARERLETTIRRNQSGNGSVV